MGDLSLSPTRKTRGERDLEASSPCGGAVANPAEAGLPLRVGGAGPEGRWELPAGGAEVRGPGPRRAGRAAGERGAGRASLLVRGRGRPSQGRGPGVSAAAWAGPDPGSAVERL